MEEDNKYLIKNQYITINYELISLVLIVGLLFFFIFAVARNHFGNEIIGNWFEKQREYTTQYWIYLEPDSSSTKNYRVKGDIEKISLGEDGWGYYLRTVYWNNGGNSDFDDCQILSIKGDNCSNIEGKSYFVRLGEKAN